MLAFLKNLIQLSPKISLAVLFLEYDTERHGGSDKVFSALQAYLSNISGCSVSYLRIDNKNESAPFHKVSEDVYSIGGDNKYREFSGWQKGYEHLHKLPGNPTVILFVNDMFQAPGESFLKDYASLDLLKRSLANRSVIGRIDSTGENYTACGYDVSRWICTNCFLAPKKAIDTIGDMVSIKENLDDFLSPVFPAITGDSPVIQPTKIFKKHAPLNEAYKLWLVKWLTEKWHSKFDLNEENWPLFRVKVRNILNESLLSAKIQDSVFSIESYGNKSYY